MNTGNSARPSITRQLWLAFGLLFIVLGLTSIIYYWQVQGIDDDVAQVVEKWEPLERTVLQTAALANRASSHRC